MTKKYVQPAAGAQTLEERVLIQAAPGADRRSIERAKCVRPVDPDPDPEMRDIDDHEI